MRYLTIVIASVLSLSLLTSPVVLAAEEGARSDKDIMSTDNMTGGSLKKIQQKLKSKGYKVGQVDGLFGPLTSRAIIKYQRDHKLAQTGFPDPAFREHLFKR